MGLLLGAIIQRLIAAPVVTVTGGDPINDTVDNGNTARAILHIRANGTILKTEQFTQTQLQPSTDWIIPNNANDGLYEVWFEKEFFFDDDPTGGDALETWHFLSANRSVEYINSTNDSVIGGGIVTRIRYNGGAEIDNGTNDLFAQVGLP